MPSMSTYALFEESGKFQAGRVMSGAETSLQVELESGKRVKVKLAQVMLRFDRPEPADLLTQAQGLAQEIDLDLAWEFATDEDFHFLDFARDYFSAQAHVTQQAAALFRLFEAPHYFRRLGKGQFKKASAEVLQAALAGIERKKQMAAQIDGWAQELIAGQCPPPVYEQIYKILFKPDKNAPEYKAVVEAAKRSKHSPLDLLKAAGAIDSPYQFHWRRFLFEHFPQGTSFPALSVPLLKENLPASEVQAFSIDDSSTTEIDDALSVQGIGSGKVTLGIHIAAPALAISPGSPLDKVARDRLSTVYMPGHKLTMLPAEVVSSYTLSEGRLCPAVSLYLELDESTLAIMSTQTRVERVLIAANLRHDQLESVVTVETLTGTSEASYPFAAELAFAFRLALHLKAVREEVRGKPENFNRPDYIFNLEGVEQEPTGQERVDISVRSRGAPLDLIVAETMILANSTWGAWLAQCGVPGIYRSQASMAPGVKVRMGTKPAPHAGMGVAQYTWATSPLRRYVDLVNQWQIVACARHGLTAALVAPFKPKDAALFAIISGFDAAYAGYNGFQSSIERYWALQYLLQNGLTELDATVMKEGLVRAESLPLVFKAHGADSLVRGTKVRVRVLGTDLLTLDLHATVIAQQGPSPETGLTPADTQAPDDLHDDPADNAGPITLAIDLQESPPDNG